MFARAAIHRSTRKPGDDLALGRPRARQLTVTEHQVKDQGDQQNAADSDPAAIAIAPVPKAAAEQQQNDQEDQEQVHLSFPWWLRKALSFYRAPFANAQPGRVSSSASPVSPFEGKSTPGRWAPRATGL